MQFRILGPLEIVVDGRAVPTAAPRLCSLLTILLLRLHRPVPVDELIDGLRPDGTASDSYRAHLHTTVARHHRHRRTADPRPRLRLGGC
jgi:DNA-binding SARP family transcriptional activator